MNYRYKGKGFRDPIAKGENAVLASHRLLRGALIAGAFALASLSMPSANGADAIPNFAPNADTGWQLTDDEFIPPPSGPGPVVSDPAHPYISFYRFPRNPDPTFRVADLSNPILQPWVREALRKANERSLSGKYIAI